MTKSRGLGPKSIAERAQYQETVIKRPEGPTLETLPSADETGALAPAPPQQPTQQTPERFGLTRRVWNGFTDNPLPALLAIGAVIFSSILAYFFWAVQQTQDKLFSINREVGSISKTLENNDARTSSIEAEIGKVEQRLNESIADTGRRIDRQEQRLDRLVEAPRSKRR